MNTLNAFLASGKQPPTHRERSALLDLARSEILSLQTSSTNTNMPQQEYKYLDAMAAMPRAEREALLNPEAPIAASARPAAKPAPKPAPKAPAPKNLLETYLAMPAGAAKRTFLAQHGVQIQSLAKNSNR